MKLVDVVIGTRPEAIKMLPLYLELEAHPYFKVRLVSTGQHREMLNQVLSAFDVKPDLDFAIMDHVENIEDVYILVMRRYSELLRISSPDISLVHGDTATAAAAAQACFLNRVECHHVEAGLRTYDMRQPFPEEANRRLISIYASKHYAPTNKARQNLLAEGINGCDIHVTGNTVIDALRLINDSRGKSEENNRKRVLITGHRRENFGQGFENICTAVKSLAKKYPGSDFEYPVHLNPNVRKIVMERLGGLSNVKLSEPKDYFEFVRLMADSFLILTDSGGIQEEAPFFGVPVLVMRNTTERPEAITAGTAKLIGTNADDIEREVDRLFLDHDVYKDMAVAKSPFGDGYASRKIIKILLDC